MHVLTRSVPVPDDRDPTGSLREMYTYLFDLSEQIDYTLARQGIQLGRVSLPATREQVDKLTVLSQQLQSTVTAVSGQAAQTEAAAAELLKQVTDLSARVEAAEAAIGALEARLTALERGDSE